MNTLVGLIVACLAINAFGLPSSQIIGGKDALDGLYPYQASLRDSLNRYFCSGAIISAHYVITAAQCLEKDEPYNVNVAVGSNYLDTPYALYKATILIVHAGYNELLYLNDIGLIYISETILFNEKVQPITLPVVDRNYDNYPLIVTGWGKLWADGSSPNHLQEIIVKGYSQETCKSIFNNLKKTHICTFTMMGEGMCYGDAGSPLVADGVLIGLASYGYRSCGLPISQIVGGKNATNGMYPYQASLRDSKNNRHFCGGAIISKSFIITAAHCLNNLNDPSDVLVGIGSNYLDALTVYQVANFIQHDEYDSLSQINDIGLIRVMQKIKFNENIQPIALVTEDRNYEGRNFVVTGWGRLENDGLNPNCLQQIILKGYSQKECNRHYENNIRKTQICTRTEQGEGMCKGDSGGPLVADDVLVGLVSFGMLPCGSGFPDVFTRVFYYRDWIDNSIQGFE
ncbi:Chymotrypsin-2 [Camponotus floridanus]|uniref:chymotrypsin n=1 Tax=Camponotus floridanus TaxID=104421 RepID=E1ZWT7_CAMFO|nr:Chymotrypsin-2 [Camponotus floridanus]